LAAWSSALALGFVAWRRRRARSKAVHALGGAHAVRIASIVSVVLTVLLGAVREGRASVSIAIQLEELARNSTAAAIVRPVEHRAVWENGRIFSYTRVQVEEVVAGNLAAEIWVRTMGGAVGTTGQLVEGEAVLELGQRAMLFLKPQLDEMARPVTGNFEVTARAQGHFLIAIDENKEPRLVSSRALGALVAPSLRPLARPIGPFAVEALHGRSVVDATRQIAELWRSVRAR